jgi:hypothetical protein
MAHWKKSFPSKYRQASDLDTPVLATIAETRSENVGVGEDQELKLVVRFREPNVKSVVLNLTRAEAIERVAGNCDTDKWPGTLIRLSRGSTLYKGRRVDCIAIDAPSPAASAVLTDAVGF